MAEIKFCENNLSQGVEGIINKLRSEGNKVEIEPCLGYCGDCMSGPFSLVDDEFIEAETPEQLYEEIKKAVD